MAMLNGKRINLKRTRPNPIFQDWLEELHEEAKEKKSKLESKLQKACISLSKYPLPLETGAECAILDGFDKTLCLFLDKRLEIFKSDSYSAPTIVENQISNTENCQEVSNDSNSDRHTTASEDINRETNIETSGEKYKPVLKSGSFAILLGLLEFVEDNISKPVKKEDLIEKAQKYSEESFKRPKPGTFYTAWSSSSLLLKKRLIKKNGVKNPTFCLTPQGVTFAKNLLKEYQSVPSTSDMIFNHDNYENRTVDTSSTYDKVAETVNVNVENHDNESLHIDIFNNDLVEMQPGSFDIILLIDKNETSGLLKKNDPTIAQFNKYPQLKHEYRSLKVGDFTWIARQKENKDSELILPYIVERKRMDDFGASIKDGRFHEQKFRLRRCGLKNVIYMVESYGNNKHVGLPTQSLMQALANTRIQDGFKVQMTHSLSNSIRFLAMLTKRLTIQYEDKHLKGSNQGQSDYLMTFEYFNKAALKNKPLTVTDTFLKLLLQLKGVSVEKALAITNTYKTPHSLIEEYKKHNKKEGELLLANLKYCETGKNVGPCVSKTLYKLFTMEDIV